MADPGPRGYAVYVYDLRSVMPGALPLPYAKPRAQSKHRRGVGYGDIVGQHGDRVRGNSPFGAHSPLLEQLYSLRTRDPAAADLFFVPSPMDPAWCPNVTATLSRYWAATPDGAAARIDYFARRGGADHFTSFQWREHMRRACRGAWLHRPLDRLLKVVCNLWP